MEETQFLTLREYYKLAEGCFMKCRKRQGSEDEIARVVEYMIRADNKFKQGEKGHRDKFRFYYGRFGALPSKNNTLDFHHKKTHTTINITDIPDKRHTPDIKFDLYDFILTHSSYGKMFIEYYSEGYTLKDLAIKYNMSPNTIKRHLKDTQERLRQQYV